MEDFDLFVLARAVHVFAIVLWIGGVAFVTTVLIPALLSYEDKQQQFALFELLEGRFAAQAKFVTLLAGISGFYMLDFIDGWHRFSQLAYWWLHLMVLVWLLFTVVLFLLEPLFLHRWFKQKAQGDSQATLKQIHTFHKMLLTLSLIAVLGATAGSHGYVF